MSTPDKTDGEASTEAIPLHAFEVTSRPDGADPHSGNRFRELRALTDDGTARTCVIEGGLDDPDVGEHLDSIRSLGLNVHTELERQGGINCVRITVWRGDAVDPQDDASEEVPDDMVDDAPFGTFERRLPPAPADDELRLTAAEWEARQSVVPPRQEGGM